MHDLSFKCNFTLYLIAATHTLLYFMYKIVVTNTIFYALALIINFLYVYSN